MAIDNGRIADTFDELADLLEIEGANPFRVRAYRNAASTVRGHSRAMAELVAAGEDLSRLPGIGKDIAQKIGTIVETGELPLLEEVATRTPRALSRLMKIEGLGPKRVKTLYEELHISSAEDLKRAVRNGAIRRLPGFGEKLEHVIGERVDELAGAEARTKLSSAERVAAPLVEYLEKIKGVGDVTIAGSYRRCRDTVGDLDILVTASKGAKVMARFVAYDEVETVISQGDTRSTVHLAGGMQVDLRVVPKVSYGAALHYFTGSKAHNIAMRRLAMRRGYKINEYGVFEGDKRIAGRTEREVYAALGLPPIPPELRENRGEIRAAREGRLPKLVELDDLRGDLHCHTDASDGRDSLERMAEAAAERGYEYLSINDHSKHVAVAHGLDEKRLRAQIEAIDELNERLEGLTLLKSAEVDILEDGSLDFPDGVLAALDFTVCAVHYQLALPRRRQTERILRAMDNPHFNILAHPTGRLINERRAYDVDIEAVLAGAAERGCIVELDSQPDRLDLTDDACKLAKDIGAKVSISSDAHSAEQLGFVRYGIYQARRGWLEAGDVVNTRSLAELRKLLSRR